MEKKCTKCSAKFDITDDDLKFYDAVSPLISGKKIALPPPTQCPDCRRQRRMAYRNDRSLYRRKCSLCGKDIISVFSPDKPVETYCSPCWWSDKWDPMKYGVEYDPNRSFFDQFIEMYMKMPHIALMNDNEVGSENCEYTHDFGYGKNCYFVTGSWKVQDSMYSDTANKDKDVCDCLYVYESELVYDSLYSQKLYSCTYMQNSESCNNCHFGYDMKGCSDCIACFGLRQKKFYIFNKPYSEKEYWEKVSSFRLDTYTGQQKMKQEFARFIRQFPHKYANIQNCENSVGDNLFNSKNVNGFDLFNSENCKFFVRSDGAINCYDVTQTGEPQWCYEGITPDNSWQALFTLWCWKCKFIYYCNNCHSSENLFGCSSLKRGKYCILNRQYTQQRYEELVPKIIEDMIKRGEWGEYFPITSSPFAYNESIAFDDFPISKEDALKSGLKWYDEPEKKAQSNTQKYEIPDSIKDVPAEITDKILNCINCGKAYKIQKAELKFYQNMRSSGPTYIGLPIPRKCYACRHQDRISLRPPRKLYKRVCDNCGKDIMTNFSQVVPWKVFCEECYLAKIY